VAAVSIQVVVGEAGASHQPRSFSNDLGGIAVGVAVDTVEHLSIAAKDEPFCCCCFELTEGE
jgi:hypothetical protein